jgi:hypothetical protein
MDSDDDNRSSLTEGDDDYDEHVENEIADLNLFETAHSDSPDDDATTKRRFLERKQALHQWITQRANEYSQVHPWKVDLPPCDAPMTEKRRLRQLTYVHLQQHQRRVLPRLRAHKTRDCNQAAARARTIRRP